MSVHISGGHKPVLSKWPNIIMQTTLHDNQRILVFRCMPMILVKFQWGHPKVEIIATL